ncbi:MAG: TIGR02710 family CRISPR-associated protein [Methanobrevibacter sp.]|jgi:CRISPR-associated protein (TIGR02710 family)|nr:TIGR02710 family CRISPR-associated protein [Candidatus Methanoflexus mossambicus]
MKRLLFITIGTGTKTKKGYINFEEQVTGICHIINSQNPDNIVFFGSKRPENADKNNIYSEDTFKQIKNNYFNEYCDSIENISNFIKFSNEHNFQSCISDFNNVLLKYNDDSNDIIVCPFGGTKEMTNAAVLCSGIYKKTLINKIAGFDDDGKIKLVDYELVDSIYEISDKDNLDKLKIAFNQNNFYYATRKLKDIVKLVDNKQEYKKLILTYDNWDKFNHEKSKSNFPENYEKIIPENKERIELNRSALEIICNKDENLRSYYILADLLNNAERKADKKNFDDAIARLYRSLELIGQIRLKLNYDINTSDINKLNFIKLKKEYDLNDEDIIIKIENKLKVAEENKLNGERPDKATIGSYDAFTLLKVLNDDIGLKFFEEKIYDKLSFRNNSILAHGLEPKTGREYKTFKKVIDPFAKQLYENIEELKDKTKFPKFKLN